MSLRGGSLHDGFGGLDGFGGSGEHFTLLCWSFVYKIQHNEVTVAVLTVLAVSAVMAVSVMTATPLKLNPPFFRDPEERAITGTPAGRPLFVPLGVPGTPGRCPDDFLKFMCLFFSE